MMRAILVGMMMALGSVVTLGCNGCSGTNPPPSTLPSDIGAEATCVLGQITAGDFDPAKIMAACSVPTEAIAVDIMEWLLSSPTVQAQVKPNLEAARQSVAHWRIAHPAGPAAPP